jgi:hypothetical protein
MCAEVKLLLQFTYMEIIYQVLSFLPAVISEPYRMNYRVSQKNRKLLKSLIVKIECPTKKLNVMMRKILTRCMY